MNRRRSQFLSLSAFALMSMIAQSSRCAELGNADPANAPAGEAAQASIDSLDSTPTSTATSAGAPAANAAPEAPIVAPLSDAPSASRVPLPPPAHVSAPSQAPHTVQPGEPPSSAPVNTASLSQEQRFALVIGNSKYKEGSLLNPANDARAIAAKLKELGFQVTEKENAGRADMADLSRKFGDRLKLGGVGLFYYAGHGIQAGGVNYLIPVDADIQDDDELSSRAFNANELLGKMDSAKNRLNIVILDACRNNPFAQSFRSPSRGLAQLEQGSGTIIAYATQPGKTAADGSGKNGLYTTELLQALSLPGLSVEEVFKQVRMEVMKKSNGAQIPWELSSLNGNFYFNPTAEQAALTPTLVSRVGPTDVDESPPRGLTPPLVSKKLLESFQLSSNLALQATMYLAKFSADGRSFLTLTKDQRLNVWNTISGNASLSRADFGAPSLSSDGRFLVGLSGGKTINVIDTETNSFNVRPYTLNEEATMAAVSPDGRRILVHTANHGFFFLSTDNAAMLGEQRKVDGDPQWLFAPHGNRAVLWGSNDSVLYIWDTETGKRIGRASSHRKPVTLARFSQDGQYLVTAAPGDSTILWQTSDGAMLRKLTFAEGSPMPTQVEFIDEGKFLLVNAPKSGKTLDGVSTLGVWDVSTGKQVSTVIPNVLVKHIEFSPDRSRAFITVSDNSTRVIDIATRSTMDVLSGAELVGYSADGHRLIAHDVDGIRLYESPSLRPIARMPGQLAAFIPPKSNKMFATAAVDGGVRLWDLDRGDPQGDLKGHINPVSVVSFSPDAKQLATFSDDKIAKIWGLPSVQNLASLAKDNFETTSEYEKRVADWSSDYTTLVTLGEYDADAETYTVKVGELPIKVPMPRDDARRLAGQREAVLTARLKVFDKDQLQLADSKLSRVP